MPSGLFRRRAAAASAASGARAPAAAAAAAERGQAPECTRTPLASPVAAGADRVILLCGPRGRAAADLLPGVDEVIDSLEAAGIAPNGEHAMEPIEEAVAAVYAELIEAGKLDDASAASAAA